MNPSRVGLVALVAFALSALFQPVRAEVRTLHPVQTLANPNPAYELFGVGIAIDGPYLIVLAIDSGEASHTYAALLYRRSLSDGKWVYRKTLVTRNGAFLRVDVRMKGGIAAVQFGGQVSLFEYVNSDYVPALVAAPIAHPGGVAISYGRVLVGGNDCDDDGVVYEKGGNGLWNLSGRLDDNTGECVAEGLSAELNYNYAILRNQYANVGKAWRRTGTAVDWVPAGTLTLPPGAGATPQPFALQGATAVASNGYAYLRTGTSTWTLQGRATALDSEGGDGITFDAILRDGVLVTTEAGVVWATPRVYIETSPGKFEHVASLYTATTPVEMDLSGHTVVTVVRDNQGTRWDIEVFTLPEPIRGPRPVVNDFEDRNATDFEPRTGVFQVATRGTNEVFEQSNPVGYSVALATESDWTHYQKIETIIAPTFTASDSWAGVVARYTDSRNYYFAGVRRNGTFGVYKRVNGVNTLLREATLAYGTARAVALVVDGNEIFFATDREYVFVGTDSSLPHGRAGVATWKATADFDDVSVFGTLDYGLFYREWGPYGSQYDIDLTTVGGDWQIPTDIDGNSKALVQMDTSGDARAYIGVPVANQAVMTRVRLDHFGSSSQGAWYGLLARYVDPLNHYYVTVRSTGQIQIRKIVNGAITVLASANFTAVPGEVHDLTFQLINDQLELWVDTVLVARAHDSDIASGRYGIATYRTAAAFEMVSASQP